MRRAATSTSTSRRVWSAPTENRRRLRVPGVRLRAGPGKSVVATAGVGFEPTDGLSRQRFSRPPRSTAPAPRRASIEADVRTGEERGTKGEMRAAACFAFVLFGFAAFAPSAMAESGLISAATTPVAQATAAVVVDAQPATEQVSAVTEQAAPVVSAVVQAAAPVTQTTAPVVQAAATIAAPVVETASKTVAPVVEPVARRSAPVAQAHAPSVQTAEAPTPNAPAAPAPDHCNGALDAGPARQQPRRRCVDRQRSRGRSSSSRPRRSR